MMAPPLKNVSSFLKHWRTGEMEDTHGGLEEEEVFRKLLPSYQKNTRDWLEACFSKPSRGGGEVVDVSYDKKKRSGQVAFLNTGVAENLTIKKKYCLDANRKIAVSTFPSMEYKLKNIQSFCGVTKRTVLLEGLEDILDDEDQQDVLEIHFQKQTSCGGEVESIKYLSKGKEAQAYFTEDTT